MKTLFVSSTFRDMHYERDAIRERALPKINAQAKKFGQEISFCDLRWGINTLDLDGAEGSKKVLDVCLDQIDRCDPPMVILLGDRYGYIPDKDIIADAAHAKSLELKDLEISVTALEIEYGFLSREQKQRTLVYFRNTVNAPDGYGSEDGEHAAKLDKLKARILEIVGDNYRTYTVDYSRGEPDMAEFADAVATDVTNVLMPEWQKQSLVSAFELDRQTQWSFISDRNSICRGRDRLIARLADSIENGNCRVTLKGASGSGKSVVFSRLACVLREKGYDVLPFVGGLTTESNDSLDVLRNTVLYLQNKLDGTPYDQIIKARRDCKADEWRKLAAEYINRYCDKGNRFVVMVDAVDQLFDDDYRKSNAFIPDVNNKNFVFFATCTTEYNGLNVGSIPLSELNADERKSVIDGIMSRYGRELDKTVIDTMIKLPSASNPLYLSFLVKRLLMMNKYDYEQIGMHGGQMDAISAHQHSIISSCPADTAEMCALLLSEAGKRINEKLISRVIGYLACSRFGLRESDLAALIGEEWNTLDFLHFIMYLGDCFILRDDGRYDFSHKSIRQGIVKTIDVKKTNAEIAAYLCTLHNDDIAQRETIYHIVCADDKRLFYDYTCSIALDAANTDVSQLSQEERDAATQSFVAYMSSAVEFVSGDGEWIARAVENAPSDNADCATVFVLAIFGFVSAETRTGVHIDMAYLIAKALLNYAMRLKNDGVRDADTLVRVARIGYSAACVLGGTDDEFAAVVSDSLADTRAAYEENPNDDTLYAYICSARQKIVAPDPDADYESHVERISEELNMLARIAEDRYAFEPNASTARNIFTVLNTNAVWSYMTKKFELAAELFERADKCALGYATEMHDIDVTALFDLSMSVGGMMLDSYVSLVQNSDDGDGEDDEDNFDETYEYDENEDDSEADDDFMREFEAALDDLIANPDKYEDFYPDADGDEDFDDDNDEQASRSLLSKIVKENFEFVLDLYALLDKAGRKGYEANACVACAQLASMQVVNGDLNGAFKYLDLGDMLVEIAERGGKLTADTRSMAYKLKSIRLTARINGGDTDYSDLIVVASDIVRDAENMSSATLMGNNALIEALSTLIGIYSQKIYADYENDRVVMSDVAEAEKLCDRMDEVCAGMPVTGNAVREGIDAIRMLIKIIKSGM